MESIIYSMKIRRKVVMVSYYEDILAQGRMQEKSYTVS